jgi:hypothetical protein
MQRSRRALIVRAVVAVMAVAAAAALWIAYERLQSPETAAPSPPAGRAPAAPAAPAASAGETVEYPLAAQPPAEVLAAPVVPPGDALAAFRADLAALLDPVALARHVDPDSLPRTAVSTVDNLAADELPMTARVVRAIAGSFAVRIQGDTIELDPANARRYEPFVALLESLDTRRAVELYVRHYRLFQGEYRGQGSPGRYFNDRVVAAIDHLLGTPVVDGPIRLVQPRVLYRFADPELESQSAGRKALIRMGPENARRVKAKLRDLRAELVRQGGTGAAVGR